MIIMGIETSCDDTGISIIEAKGRKSPSFRILANNIASQIEIHQKYGGVYPNMAKREHETNLPIVVSKALKKAKLDPLHPALDALAITYGPGLSPCLWAGLNKAQELTKQWNVPLIPTNHMEGHLLISLFLGSPKRGLGIPKPRLGNILPALALLVSGGHTQLIFVSALGKYKLLGETRDDAAGECFDKTARVLGLPYPGGPAISQQAQLCETNIYKLRLPRPMISTKDYDFSFSGLKTAVLYDWKSRSKKVRESTVYTQEMAKEIQKAIIEVLVQKTLKAAHRYSAKAIILGGGVGANKLLRNTLLKETKKFGMRFLVAPPEFCTDNGAMIAVAGYATWLRSGFKKHKHIEAQPNLSL
ncbi:MAG: tRNA (adenosine(37)-N6)-threonylcarbamoyltransferase complex transferase subunit TsaD [bacterium]|nr:tRNA (adenosine(37)-N6)-threonylcarbamoyltransferase complex transferase subunit TsaD [bacterium]